MSRRKRSRPTPRPPATAARPANAADHDATTGPTNSASRPPAEPRTTTRGTPATAAPGAHPTAGTTADDTTGPTSNATHPPPEPRTSTRGTPAPSAPAERGRRTTAPPHISAAASPATAEVRARTGPTAEAGPEPVAAGTEARSSRAPALAGPAGGEGVTDPGRSPAVSRTKAGRTPKGSAERLRTPDATGREAPPSAPPAGPKTARPRKPGPGGPPAPFPGPIRGLYPPVGASVTTAEASYGDEPAGAFDALYGEVAGPLRRQVYVLTADRELAGQAVERAFDAAWQRWPEVARDSDPAGWLRAAAHTYALAPWQRPWRRLRRRLRKAAPQPEGAWWRALVRLHPERRRALLLHDGLGMSLARTAAEVEASTTAAASRIIAARRALATAAPETYDGGDAGEHLTGLLAAARADEQPPPAADGVREASERATRRRTIASFAAAGTVLVATTVCMFVAPQPGDARHHSPAHQQPYAQTPNGPPPEGKQAAP